MINLVDLGLIFTYKKKKKMKIEKFCISLQRLYRYLYIRMRQKANYSNNPLVLFCT